MIHGRGGMALGRLILGGAAKILEPIGLFVNWQPAEVAGQPRGAGGKVQVTPHGGSEAQERN